MNQVWVEWEWLVKVENLGLLKLVLQRAVAIVNALDWVEGQLRDTVDLWDLGFIVVLVGRLQLLLVDSLNTTLLVVRWVQVVLGIVLADAIVDLFFSAHCDVWLTRFSRASLQTLRNEGGIAVYV